MRHGDMYDAMEKVVSMRVEQPLLFLDYKKTRILIQTLNIKEILWSILEKK